MRSDRPVCRRRDQSGPLTDSGCAVVGRQPDSWYRESAAGDPPSQAKALLRRVAD